MATVGTAVRFEPMSQEGEAFRQAPVFQRLGEVESATLGPFVIAIISLISQGGSVFWGETGEEQAFQFLDSSGVFQTPRQVREFVLLAGESHGLAEAVGPLVLPPFFCRPRSSRDAPVASRADPPGRGRV